MKIFSKIAINSENIGLQYSHYLWLEPLASGSLNFASRQNLSKFRWHGLAQLAAIRRPHGEWVKSTQRRQPA